MGNCCTFPKSQYHPIVDLDSYYTRFEYNEYNEYNYGFNENENDNKYNDSNESKKVFENYTTVM